MCSIVKLTLILELEVYSENAIIRKYTRSHCTYQTCLTAWSYGWNWFGLLGSMGY